MTMLVAAIVTLISGAALVFIVLFVAMLLSVRNA